MIQFITPLNDPIVGMIDKIFTQVAKEECAYNRYEEFNLEEKCMKRASLLSTEKYNLERDYAYKLVKS